MHLIAGTSFYVEPLMPDRVKSMSREEVRDSSVDVNPQCEQHGYCMYGCRFSPQVREMVYNEVEPSIIKRP